MHNIQHKVVLVAVILLTYCSLMGYSPQQFSYNRDYLTLGVRNPVDEDRQSAQTLY